MSVFEMVFVFLKENNYENTNDFGIITLISNIIRTK